MPSRIDDERAPVRLAGCEKSHHLWVDCILSFCTPPRGVFADLRANPALFSAAANLHWCGHETMSELVADRFVAFGRTWIDVASGAPVRLRFVRAGHVSEEILRNEQCAERARLRHPLMNVLLDYGVVDRQRMFEAYSIGDPLASRVAAASELLQHAGRFLASRGLPLTAHASRTRVARGWRCREWLVRRGRRVLEREGAGAHPSAAGHARKPARGARGRQSWRDDEHRDCGRAGGRTPHRPAARGAHRADGRARSGRERRARAAAVAAGPPGSRAAPLHPARRAPARRAGHSRDVPRPDGHRKRAAARPAPIHPN